jgi:MSHA biogenesis protein MshG
MASLSPNLLFAPARFKHEPWILYRFSVSTTRGKKTFSRKVDVYCPVRVAAPLGTGSQADEMVREIPLSDGMRFMRTTGLALKAKPEEVITFLNAMGQNLSVEVPLLVALRRAATNAKTPYFRGVLATMAYYVSTVGGELSKVMALFPGAFNDVVLARIEAGEAQGETAAAFKALGQTEKADYLLAKKLRSLMAYPMVLAVALTGLFCLIQFFVIPRMAPIFGLLKHSGIPTSTKIVMAFANFSKDYWWLYFVPVIFCVWAIKNRKLILSNPHVQRLLLHIPGLGEAMRHVIVIRSLRVLGTLLRSGAAMPRVFAIVGRVSGNVVYAEYFAAIFDRMRKGDDMDKAFFAERHRIGEMGLDIAIQMEVSAETANPVDSLETIIDIQQSNLNAKMETMPVLLNAFMLTLVLPFFVLLTLAVIEPSLQLAQEATSMGGM